MKQSEFPRILGWMMVSFLMGFLLACLLFVFQGHRVLESWGWKIVRIEKPFENLLTKEPPTQISDPLPPPRVSPPPEVPATVASLPAPVPEPVPELAPSNPVPIVASLPPTIKVEPAVPAPPIVLENQVTPPVVAATARKYSRRVTRVERLTDSTFIDWQASISRDGQFLAYSAEVAGPRTGSRVFNIFLLNLETRVRTRLTESEGHEYTPVFSPDGKKIAFSREMGKGNEDIFTLALDSRETKNLTTSPHKEMMPAFSPDGARVAFVSNKHGNNDIFLMDIDGGAPFALTRDPADEREPCFQPSGSHLLYTRIVEKLKESDLMLLPLEPLGTPRNLTPEVGRAWSATFSDDGEEIFFTHCSATQPRNHLFRMRLDGLGREPLLPQSKDQEFSPRAGRGQLFFHAEKRVEGVVNKDIFRILFEPFEE